MVVVTLNELGTMNFEPHTSLFSRHLLTVAC
jgi:hypothetical protein